VLEVTIAFSLAVSWASCAADFSRYLPADSSRARVFGFTIAGIVLASIYVQAIGIAAGDVLAEHTAEGVRSVMGGGLLGALALVVIALPASVAVVVIDWLFRARGRETINPAAERTGRADTTAALIAFVLAYARAVPFMNATLIRGPIATAWHGADIAYFVNPLVAAVLYGGWRLLRMRR
jgi:nucleobase:cation symporter-1, NCS1 family